MGRLADLVSSAVRSYWMPPLPTRDPALAAMLGYGPTASGVTVNESTALTLSAVWACVNLIASAVASLPLVLYRRLPDGGRERFEDHPLYELLHDRPNPEMTSVMFRETMQAHVLTSGNAYAEIVRNGAGQVKELWPLAPSRVMPDRDGRGPIFYRVLPADGRGAEQRLAADEMFHLPGLSRDGVVGLSVIAYARETLGLGIAVRKYGAQFFGNGAVSSLVAKHPGSLSKTAQDNLKDSILESVGGDQKHSVLILEEGMTVEKISIPPDDAQFLETQRFSVAEVARIFGVPPHMIGDVERSTSWGTGIEQQGIGFVRYTLKRWLERWEQECEKKLIARLERKQQYVEHIVDSLQAPDFKTKTEAYVALANAGLTTANRVARLENWDPFGPTGDMRLVPLNMVPADRVNDVIDAQVRPAAAPATPEPDDDEPEPNDDRTAKALEDLRSEVEKSRLDPVQLTDTMTAGVASVLAKLSPSESPTVDLAPVLDAIGEASARIMGVEQVTAAEIREARDAVDAARSDITGRLEALPEPPPSVDVTPVVQAVETASVEIRSQIGLVLEGAAATHRTVETTGEDIKAHLVMAEELRRVKRAAVAIVAGTLVRRERDKIKSITQDSSKAFGLQDFYAVRIIVDGARLLAEMAPDSIVRTALETWSRDAMVEISTAMTDGTISAVPGRWVDRHEQMTNALMEAINHG